MEGTCWCPTWRAEEGTVLCEPVTAAGVVRLDATAAPAGVAMTRGLEGTWTTSSPETYHTEREREEAPDVRGGGARTAEGV
jgi:hypothetical protein